jgi:arginase family enzyme
MRQTLDYLDPIKNPKEHKSAPFHISFDIDAMEPYLAEATGTIYRGGLSLR